MIDSVFLEAVLASLGAVSLWVLNEVATNLKNLTVSVNILNAQIAVIVARVDSHETRITKLEE